METATLDLDATLTGTHKRNAFYCYKKFKAYQPMNMYWDEQKILLQSEFRDGNVPASFELLRILQESLNKVPETIGRVYLRSDTAAYQSELIDYCVNGQHDKVKKIEFAISAKITRGFKEATLALKNSDWHCIEKIDKQGNVFKTEQEWAEVCFVPDWTVYRKDSPDCRYIAIREKMAPLKPKQAADDLPFQTVLFEEARYKLFGIVTNRDLPGSELIQWHRARCGDSEKVHSIEKSELAGGQLPSGLFGANAAWWQIMILSFNVNQLMKQWVMPAAFKTKGLKALRFHIVGIAGRVIKHARRWIVRLSGGNQSLALFSEIRANIQALSVILDSG